MLHIQIVAARGIGDRAAMQHSATRFQQQKAFNRRVHARVDGIIRVHDAVKAATPVARGGTLGADGEYPEVSGGEDFWRELAQIDAESRVPEMAPEVGFEPTTNRLTADRSTTELLRITHWK